MRQLKALIPVIIIAIVLVGGASAIAVRYSNNHTKATKQKIAVQSQQLSAWQAKVKAWNIQAAKDKQATATTSGQSQTTNLSNAGVTQLPHTGPAGVVLIGMVAGLSGTVLYQARLRRGIGIVESNEIAYA